MLSFYGTFTCLLTLFYAVLGSSGSDPSCVEVLLIHSYVLGLFIKVAVGKIKEREADNTKELCSVSASISV